MRILRVWSRELERDYCISNLLKITSKEANSVVKFFASNDLVNNAEKAAALYNENGKGECIKIDNIGGENIQSSFSEKLLGLHLS